MKNLPSVFPERLRSLRTTKGLTQSELADELGISRNSVFFYESGQRNPDILVLKKIAEYFGVTSDFMIGTAISKLEIAWEQSQSGCIYFCSRCGYFAMPREVREWNYCPKCGAKMRKENLL